MPSVSAYNGKKGVDGFLQQAFFMPDRRCAPLMRIRELMAQAEWLKSCWDAQYCECHVFS